MTTRQGLTVVGQVIGAYFGPVGSAIGGAIGGFIGGEIDGPQKGPRLDDTNAPAIEFGAKCPRVYGRVWVTLSPLWWSKLRESTVNSGGKGAADQTTDNYVYHCDILGRLADGANVIAWTRIRIDGKIVATQLAGSSDASLEATANTDRWSDVELRRGGPTQAPWSVMEAAEGVGNVSAYKDQCTFAITNLLMPNGRNPSLIEVEVITEGTITPGSKTSMVAHLVAEARQFDGLRPFGSYMLASTGRLAVMSPATYGSVRTYEVSGGGDSIVHDDAIPGACDAFSPGRGSGTKALMVFGNRSLAEAGFAMVGDGVSQAVSLPEFYNALGASDIRFATWGQNVAVGTAAAIGYGADPGNAYLIGNQGRIYVYTTAGALVSNIDAGLVVDSIAFNSSGLWVLVGSTIHPFSGIGSTPVAGSPFAAPSGSTLSLFVDSAGVLHCANAAQQIYRLDGTSWDLVATFDAGVGVDLGTTGCVHGATGGSFYAAKGVTQESINDFYGWLPSGSSPYADIPPYPQSDLPSVVAAVHLDLWAQFTWGAPSGYRAVRNATFVVSDIDLDYQPLPSIFGRCTVTLSAERLYGYPGDTEGTFDAPVEDWVWSATEQTFTYHRYLLADQSITRYYHDIYRHLAAVFDPGSVDLQDVLEAEMLRCAPLTSAHIDMSAAAGKEVFGFKASRSAAAECGVLLDWYYLDIFCGDKITVVERGGAVEQTIPYGYTGSGVSGTSDPFAGLTRGADVESQFATSVQYINILADGEVDTQQGQRVGTGSEVRAVNFSIYSKPTLAKGRANTITQDTRVAAHTATAHLGAKQAASIQPGSVLTLVDNKGNSYRTRVLRLVWNQGVYDVDVCLDDPNILSTVGITAEIDNSVIEVAPPIVAEFLPLDIPRLSDAQNAPGYLGLVKTGDATAARWFDSPDDVTYTARFDFANDAVFGSVTAASGSFGQGVLFDEGSSLTVNVGDGELASVTRDALLANPGLNLFAVGLDGRMVLGQFRTATLVSAGVYTLGGFVNMGGKGTEQYCASIAAGDNFAMASVSGTAQIPRSLTDLGVPFHVKAVAFGASLDNVTQVDFTANGVNLKPLSPVLLRAERDASSGDIEISWTRRTFADTRFGGDLGDAYPLGVSAELYHPRLYTDGTFATVLRDLGTVTSPSVSYAAADRVADGLALYDPLYVAVPMVSDIVGEGYPLQAAA